MKHTKDSPTPEVELTIFGMLKYLPSPYSPKSYYNNQFKDEDSTKNALNTYHQLMRSVLSFILSSKSCHLTPNCVYCIYIHFFLNYTLLCTNIPNCSFTSETGPGLFFSKRILRGRSRNHLQNDQEGMLLPV